MTTHTNNTIAIDGLAATGKGTIARKLAAALNFAYLDTGLLYRAVGINVMRSGDDLTDAKAAAREAVKLDPTSLAALMDDPALRSDEGGKAASFVAVVPEVRAALLKFQKDFAANPPQGLAGAVLDGRDIGTVIAPDAKVKIYVSARPEVRAHRRFLELQGRGENVSEATVLADMQARDERDATRAAAPALPAEDAYRLDTSDLNADEAFAAALAIVKDRLSA